MPNNFFPMYNSIFPSIFVHFQRYQFDSTIEVLVVLVNYKIKNKPLKLLFRVGGINGQAI